ncbi:MAG: hypothetical protein ACI84D_003855 [Thalassolituus oleivorans]|jgi:hypothetical protein
MKRPLTKSVILIVGLALAIGLSSASAQTSDLDV